MLPAKQVLGLTTGGMTPVVAGFLVAIMANLPERDGADLWHGMQQAAGQDRELKIVAIADGARDNGTCLESVTPDIRFIDVWQACQSLKTAADAAYGAESGKSTAWFDTHKAILTDDPQGGGEHNDRQHPAQAQRPEMGSCWGSGCSHFPDPAQIRAL